MSAALISKTIIPLIGLILIGGCGSGNSGPSGSNSTLEASKGCIDCHAAVNSPVVVTAKIVQEWADSNHNTGRSGALYGASCADCHEPQVGHPNYCGRCHGGVPTATNITGTDVVRNPDEEWKCYKCHHSKTLSAGHFSNSTSAAGSAPASYVSGKYSNKCRSCHNPHNPTALLAVNKDWAKSKHGNPKEPAWSAEDFKNNISATSGAACMRCHTATGFINFTRDISSGNLTWPAFPATSWSAAGDKSRETLACNACHDSYDFKNSVRRIPAFTAPYGGKLTLPNGAAWKVSYPDSGQSNLCIACHSGRESGGSIDDPSAAVGSFTGTITAISGAMNGQSFKNSHYLAAAEVFYGKAGFHFYTSMKKFDTGYNTGSNFGSWSHGKLGMIDPATGKNYSAFQGTPTASTVTDSGSNGPCIACHLGNQGGTVNPRSHTFNPVNAALSTAPAGGCYGCHGATGSAPENMALLIEEEKVLFDAGMSFYQWNLINNFWSSNPAYRIYYDGNYPYFHTSLPGVRGVNDFTAWSMGTGSNTIGKQIMGACFNFNLLNREKGAHVHNRTYARRLMYDSIQFLQYGTVSTSDVSRKISFTAYSTANPGLSTKLSYISGPITYKGASAIRAWLTSGSRTTGAITGFRK